MNWYTDRRNRLEELGLLDLREQPEYMTGNLLQRAVGIGELIPTLGTGIANEVYAGLRGLGGLMAAPFLGKDDPAAYAAQQVEAGREGGLFGLGSYTPQTEQGRQAAAAVGGLIQPYDEMLDKSGEAWSNLLGPAGGAMLYGLGGILDPIPGPTPRVQQLYRRMEAPDAEGELRRKINRRDDTGQPQERIVLEKDGEKMVVGDITFDDWAERVSSMDPKQIQDYREWYGVALKEFQNVFGKSKAEEYLLGWLLGNQNESPAGALRNLLRAEDKIQGIPQPYTAGLGEEKILNALGGEQIRSGAAAKLFDFVDSTTGREFRTYMGGDKAGGRPAVMDVHSTRDMGYVDETFHNWLRNEFGDQADQVNINVKGGPGRTQYERGSEKMNRFADEANRQGFLGGNWTPAEIQAVGWKYMGDKVGGGVQTIPEAVQSNIRRLSSELAFGIGSPFDQRFGEIFRNMPYNDQRWLTDYVYRSTLPALMDAVGVRGVANMAGGKYGGVTPPSVQLDALASPERASDMADMIGFGYQQDEVVNSRPLLGGDTVTLNVTLAGSPNFDQAMRFADEVTQQLDTSIWRRLVGSEGMHQGAGLNLLRSRMDVTAPGFYYMPETKTITFFLNRQPRITSTGKVSKVIEATGPLGARIESGIEEVLHNLGKKYNQRSKAEVFNSEAAWHGEEGHWAKGGRGEVYHSSLGERGRSDLQARLDDSSNQVGATTEQGIQILQSGQAPRYRRRPIRGPTRFSRTQAAPRGGLLVR